MSAFMQVVAAAPASAPWWFAGVIGVVGVVTGILAKGVIDAKTRSRQEAREDELRFAADRLKAFSEFLTAVWGLYGSIHRHNDDVSVGVSPAQIADRKKEIEEFNLQAVNHQQIIELISPDAINDARGLMRAAASGDGEAFLKALEVCQDRARLELPQARPRGK